MWATSATEDAHSAQNRRRDDAVTLEAVLRRELDHPLAGLSCHEPKRSACRVAVCATPVRMVQRVERLDTQFEPVASMNWHHFTQPHVEIPRVWIPQCVARLDAERAGRWPREGGGVEPRGGRGERRPLDRRIGEEVPELVAASGPDPAKVVLAS